MKVLYSFPHPVGGLGIGTVAWHHVDALARSGADVTLVCPTVARPFDPALAIRTVAVLGPVRPRMIGRRRAYDLLDLVAAAQVRLRAPDVVHVWPGAVLRTARAASRRGVPVLREAPSPYTRVAVAQAAAAWADIGLPVPQGHFHSISETTLALEDREFQAVDRVIVGSPEAAATFASASFSIQPSVLRYGFDPTVMRPRPRLEQDCSERAQKVVFVGRCEPTKGIHVLLRAWQQTRRPPGSILMLRGGMSADVRRVLATALAEPDVVEVGPVADMGAFLAEADTMVLPSFSEGSALITYESLGCGVLPLVSTSAGAPLEHGVDGLVHETGAVEQLVGHLDIALNDGQARAKLTSGGEGLSRAADLGFRRRPADRALWCPHRPEGRWRHAMRHIARPSHVHASSSRAPAPARVAGQPPGESPT